MKTNIMHTPARGLFLALLLVTGSSATAAISEHEVRAVRATIDTYVRAALAGDWDAWGRTLTPDAIALPNDNAPLVGRAATVAWARSLPKFTSFTVNIAEVDGQGDVAYVRGTYAISTESNDGIAGNMSGVFIEIHRRQPDGSWPYSRLIWHADATGPAPSISTQELLALENAWCEALLKADIAVLQRIYAEEYLSTDHSGATWSKAQDLASISSGDFKLASYKLEDLKVHTYGDTAVVTGRNTIKASFQGKDISGQYRFTDVLTRRSGRWQCVATQSTLVEKK